MHLTGKCFHDNKITLKSYTVYITKISNLVMYLHGHYVAKNFKVAALDAINYIILNFQKKKWR